MADVKKIIPERILDSQARITRTVEKTVATNSVDDTSQTKLENCADLIYVSSVLLGDTVYNYNKYLNDLAEAFRKYDQEMAKKLGSSVTLEPSAKTKTSEKTEEEIKNSETYKDLR